MLTLCVTEPERTSVTRLMLAVPTFTVKCCPLSMLSGAEMIAGRGASAPLDVKRYDG